MGIAKGMLLTLKHLFRPRVTTQYPDQRLHTARRIRGQQFVWKEDKCTGCATCAKSCPHGVIEIKTIQSSITNRYIVEDIIFDTGRCMYCGLCVEVCPYNALFMGRSYEQAQYTRQLLWANREILSSPEAEPSAYYHEELEAGIPRQSLLVFDEYSQELTVGEHD